MYNNKKKKVYAMIEAKGALDFRSISYKMIQEGYKMGPSRARILLIEVLEKLIKGIVEGYTGKKCNLDNKTINNIAIDVDFQNIIAPFVIAAFTKKGENFEEHIINDL